jgi:hypothetical protein
VIARQQKILKLDRKSFQSKIEKKTEFVSDYSKVPMRPYDVSPHHQPEAYSTCRTGDLVISLLHDVFLVRVAAGVH